MKILIDNGHGVNTPGKCSPDGSIYEWSYCREIAERIVNALQSQGYDAERIVTEKHDINLAERCRRVNNWCRKLGARNVLMVSVHLNASPPVDGKWHGATGWSGWVSSNCSANSKKLAKLLYSEAEKRGLQGNRWVPDCKYWVADYYILKNTNCPAVLTENLFQNNKDDVKMLLSEKGKQAIVDLHVAAIKEYING